MKWLDQFPENNTSIGPWKQVAESGSSDILAFPESVPDYMEIGGCPTCADSGEIGRPFR
jgi:hypothetical protein